MYTVDREKQIKEVLSRLEQLVLKAEKDKKEIETAYYEEDSVVDKTELLGAQAYEDGAFAAYAIVKKIFEGDYE